MCLRLCCVGAPCICADQLLYSHACCSSLSRQALGTTLRPELIYCNGRRDDAASYELRAVVCYYGSHYASFARTDEASAFSFAEPTCVPCLAARTRAVS